MVETASREPCQAAGNHVSIVGDSGLYRTTYMHFSHVGVSRGEHVMRGQPIGLSGNTGGDQGGPGCTFSGSRPHLHLTLRANAAVTARYPASQRGSERAGFTAIPAESQIAMAVSPRTATRAEVRGVRLAPGVTVAA